MDRISRWTTAALLLAVPTGAPALEGMELQRCIWACLANSTGNQNPAYHACVESQCSAGEAEPAPPPPASAWHSARLDGGWHAATALTEAGDMRLSFQCRPDAGSYLLLDLPTAPPGAQASAPVVLAVDDAAQVTLPPSDRGVLWIAQLPAAASIVAALQNGRVAALRQEDGTPLGRIALGGSAAAIGAALAGCGLG